MSLLQQTRMQSAVGHQLIIIEHYYAFQTIIGPAIVITSN